MSAKTSICPKCGSALPDDAPRGQCPICLLRCGFASEGASESSPPADEGGPPTIHIVLPVDEPAGAVPETIRYFGDYELLEQIAAGGMGVVFKARQVSLNRIVAVKMIRAGQLARAADIRRFRTEAEAAANLKHPHIVAIHEVGEHEGRQYFSMDYIEGQNLAELVRERPLEPARAAHLVRTIAQAIAYAHGRGVLHRDLKPSNVMIDAQDQPHVTDFGLAKLFDVTPASSLARSGGIPAAHSKSGGPENPPARTPAPPDLTHSGAIIGSPSYMSPEQAQGRGDQVSVRTDVYSLGAILFELLTTRPPFLAATALETMKLVAEQEPVSPRVLNLTLPRDLETVCLKCLAKDPSARYATAQDLADELGRFLRDEPIRARPVSTPEKVWRWCRRKPAVATLAGLSMTASLAFVVLLLAKNAEVRHEANRAKAQEKLATNALTRAEASEADLRQSLYASDMSLAFREAHEGNYGAALRALNAQRPPFGQPDLRGFEWRYLRAQCRGQQLETWNPGFGKVYSLAFSADGARLALGGERGIGLWDLQRRQFVFRLDEPGLGEWTEPEAQQILSSVRQSPLLPNQLAIPQPTPTQIVRFTNPLRVANTSFVSVSSDGKYFVAAHESHYPRVWDTSTGKVLHALPAYWACPVFSPAAPILAVGSYVGDLEHIGSVKVYDLDTRQEIWALPEAGGRIGISQDGEWMATGSCYNGIRIWNLKQRELHRVIPTPVKGPMHEIVAFAFSPDHRWVAAAYYGNWTIHVWNVASGQLHTEFTGHQGRIATLVFDPAGRILASGGADKTIRLWDLEARRETARLSGHTGGIADVAFSPDGNVLASASYDGTVRFWSGHPVSPPAPFGGLATVGDCLNGPWIYLRGRSRITQAGECLLHVSSSELALARPEPGAPVLRLETDKSPELCGFSVSRFQVFSLRFDQTKGPKTLLVWDKQRVKPRLVSLADSKPFLTCLNVSPDGRMLCGAQSGTTLIVWDTASGAVRVRVPLEKGAHLSSVESSPDGRLLAASATTNGQVRLFEADTGRALRDLAGPRTDWMRFSPDSQLLATANANSPSVRLWDIATGQPRGILQGHRQAVTDAAFSPDGKTLATVSEDRTLKLWNLVTQREIVTLENDALFSFVAFSPDGSYLAAFKFHGEPQVWAAPALAEVDAVSPELAR